MGSTSRHCRASMPLALIAFVLTFMSAHAYLSKNERIGQHPEVFHFPYIGRGDPDHSFLHPYIPSAGGDAVSSWFQVGSTAITRSGHGRDVVRLTSASQANQGVFYNSIRTETNNFNGYVDLQIDSAHDSHEAADGMGFFFVKDRPTIGSAMGIGHTFQGLGIVIDTFSNSRTRKVPYAYAYVSDGTKQWNPDTDGADTEVTRGCQLEMNTQIRMYIQFVDEELHVGVAMNPRQPHRWHTCFKASNIHLPFADGGYFAFAGETGHFFAMHEIHDAAFVDESAHSGENYRSEYVPQDYGNEEHHNMHPDNAHPHDYSYSSKQSHERAAQPDDSKKTHLHGERSDPATRLHQGSTATESLSGSLDLQVYDMFNEFSASLRDIHGKEVEEAKLRLNGVRDVIGHLVKEMEKQKAEMGNLINTLRHLKATSGELTYASDKFATQLKGLHSSLDALRHKTVEVSANHEEMHANVMDHQDDVQKVGGGGVVVLLFFVIQIVMVSMFVGLSRLTASSRKAGRMV